MRRICILALALLLAFAALPTAGLADNDTPETAIPLTIANPGATGHLVGNTGGAVTFYRIDYLGNGQPVVIKLTSQPGRVNTGGQFGFKMYGPKGFMGEAVIEVDESTWTRYSMTLASNTPGAYFVQAYNFTNNLAMDYNLDTTGLEAATAGAQAVPAPIANTTPDKPVSITQPNTTTGGSLGGDGKVALQYYSLVYPGAGSELAIELDYSPPSMLANHSVGFNLYSSKGDPTNNGNLVLSGNETLRDSYTVQVKGSYFSDSGDVMLLQVFNYQTDLSISYTLLIKGAAGSVNEAQNNLTSDRALLLTADMPSMRGVIPGNTKDATFNYFLLQYPGGNVPFTVVVTADQDPTFKDKTVGLNVYKGPTLVGHADSTLNAKATQRQAWVTINDANAATYGIQVFNYSGGAPVRYIIAVKGF